MPVSEPLAYLITFHTYGTWLHGDERCSVDMEHNAPGTQLVAPHEGRHRYESRKLTHPSILLDKGRRIAVREAIADVIRHRDWTLHVVNVRTNHVHVVVSAAESPERVMNALKSWSTRRLVEAGLVTKGTRPWVRHGSTRYLWKQEHVTAACAYVVEGQGADLDA